MKKITVRKRTLEFTQEEVEQIICDAFGIEDDSDTSLEIRWAADVDADDGEVTVKTVTVEITDDEKELTGSVGRFKAAVGTGEDG